jgi:hypothetical protein
VAENPDDPEWYSDPDTLKTLLAIVLAALCVRFATHQGDSGQADRVMTQPAQSRTF